MEEQNPEINQPAAEEIPVVADPANDGNQKEPETKASYWVMGIFMAIFLLCGGISYCPWWMWIIVVLFVLMTVGGLSKKYQAIIGIVVLLWGTPIFSDDDDSDSYSGSSSVSTHQSHSSSSSSSSGHPQTESERRAIEAKFVVLEQLNHRFENACQRHDYDAAKRISDEAMSVKHEMDNMNMTAEQRQRLQAMF